MLRLVIASRSELSSCSPMLHPIHLHMQPKEDVQIKKNKQPNHVTCKADAFF